MWTKNIQHSSSHDTLEYNFNGINIHAARGIHEMAFELLESLKLDHTSKICILGAGAGAFDERVYAAGYNDITSIEFNSEIYKSKGKVMSLDLNNDFADLGKFDVVVALEILEHLENQFQFLRNCKSLLSKNGSLILSTPNPKNTLSRVKFFILGDISYFNKVDIVTSGHINPVFDHVFKYYMNEIGMEIVNERKLNLWGFTFESKNLFKKFILTFLYFITLFLPKKDNRGMLIYLIRSKL